MVTIPTPKPQSHQKAPFIQQHNALRLAPRLPGSPPLSQVPVPHSLHSCTNNLSTPGSSPKKKKNVHTYSRASNVSTCRAHGWFGNDRRTCGCSKENARGQAGIDRPLCIHGRKWKARVDGLGSSLWFAAVPGMWSGRVGYEGREDS